MREHHSGDFDADTEKSLSFPVIVVLGCGRSGTSLTTRLLTEKGMEISSNLVSPKDQNLGGSFEDSDIHTTQWNLLKGVGFPNLPPLPGWMETSEAQYAKEKLMSIVRSNVQQASSVWGFKDPCTAYTLPLWHNIFNSLSVTPIYVLCVRDPNAVIKSMHTQYARSREVSELQWLTKNVNCLLDTGGNLHIVHYESWFNDNAVTQLEKLARYVGLKEGDSELIISKAVKSEWNRSSVIRTTHNNELVSRLYSALRVSSGSEFDRKHLMSIANEIDRTLSYTAGWQNEALRVLNDQSDTQKSTNNDSNPNLATELNKSFIEILRLRKENEHHANIAISYKKSSEDRECQIRKLEKELPILTDKLTESQREIFDLRSKIDKLADANESITKEKKRLTLSLGDERRAVQLRNATISDLKNKNTKLRISTTYQIGEIFVKAFYRPNIRSITWPWHISRLLFSRLFRS